MQTLGLNKFVGCVNIEIVHLSQTKVKRKNGEKEVEREVRLSLFVGSGDFGPK